jgi:hypothetical protein
MYYILFASITVIWCISMIFQFIDVIVIRYKYHEVFTDARLAPDWVFYLASLLGLLASGVGLADMPPACRAQALRVCDRDGALGSHIDRYSPLGYLDRSDRGLVADCSRDHLCHWARPYQG